MSVPVAYATIIIIWSTTPLGISWSNETLNPIAAVSFRMLVAAILGALILKALNIPIVWTKQAFRTYTVSLMGIYGAMICTYAAAEYIPSGLISVLFALSPVLSNLFTYILMGKGNFSPMRWGAFLMSFAGLAAICSDDWVMNENGWIGIVLLLVAVSLYSLSGVLVQKEKLVAHPLSITVGTLLCSMPLFIATWFLLDGQLPQIDWSSKSPWAVLYLAVFGSLIGFASYFYIVRELGATAVAMVTLMTPIIALTLGNILNNEPVTVQMMIGTSCVLFGLVMYYQNGKSMNIARLSLRSRLD